MQKPTTGTRRPAGKQPRKWYVIYRDAQGAINGPVWELESKIKPTRWTNAHLADWPGCIYTIEETESFDGGYPADGTLYTVHSL
jgi:hypothetical protein